MKISVSRKINNATVNIDIDEPKDKEALASALVMSENDYCPVCKSEDINWRSNKDKEGNIYIKRVCGGCKKESKLGTYKTGGYFWHNWEDNEYSKKTLDDVEL